MAKAGVWAFGWIEVETETGRELCAMVVDEESELVETRVFPVAEQKNGITELFASAQAQVGRPKKITVADGAIAKALRAAGVRAEITVERSPLLEEALRTLAETVTEGPAADFFAGDGVEPGHVQAFFAAAARLWEVEPWWTFEMGTAFSVRAAELAVEEGAVFLMGGSDDDGEDAKSAEGEDEESSGGGWMLVFSQDDMAGLGQAMDADAGSPGELANVLAMQFEHADQMGPKLDEFLEEHELVIAERDAVPTLSRSVRGTGMVAPSAKDYELATAMCVALAELGEKAGAATSEEEMLEVTATTASGIAVVVAGPMDEEDELEDEADEAMWTPPQHPWIEDVEAFVAERPEQIDETARRQLHLFCVGSATEGGSPETWGERDLRSFLTMVATTLPTLREEVGGLLGVVATWIDVRAGLEGERSVRALVAREQDTMIERVMDPEGWAPEKKVMIALREEGVDLMDDEATTAALERLFGKQDLG